MRPGIRNSFGRNRVILSSIEYLLRVDIKQIFKNILMINARRKPFNGLTNVFLRADPSGYDRSAIVDHEKSVGLHPEAPIGEAIHKSSDDGKTASFVTHFCATRASNSSQARQHAVTVTDSNWKYAGMALTASQLVFHVLYSCVNRVVNCRRRLGGRPLILCLTRTCCIKMNKNC